MISLDIYHPYSLIHSPKFWLHMLLLSDIFCAYHDLFKDVLFNIPIYKKNSTKLYLNLVTENDISSIYIYITGLYNRGQSKCQHAKLIIGLYIKCVYREAVTTNSYTAFERL